MFKHLLDILTLLQSRYEKQLRPSICNFKKFPGGHYILCMPPVFINSLIFLICLSSQHSITYATLSNSLAQMKVAQIGGITRSIFDDALTLVRLNTHDWRSGEKGDDGGDYIKIDGLKLPVDDESFDVVASRHVLEHTSNPIATLLEWKGY